MRLGGDCLRGPWMLVTDTDPDAAEKAAVAVRDVNHGGYENTDRDGITRSGNGSDEDDLFAPMGDESSDEEWLVRRQVPSWDHVVVVVVVVGGADAGAGKGKPRWRKGIRLSS